MSVNLLLTGPRGVGKSTVVARALDLLRHTHAGGYVTERLGPREQPAAHLLRDLAGPERVIAHRDFTSGPRFGPYRVDLGAFETVGVAALQSARRDADLIIADEIGRMEEGAPVFHAELEACLSGVKPFLGVLSDRRGEFVHSILARDDVRVIEVTEAGREVLPGAIAAVLGWAVLGPEALELPAAAGVILAGGRGTRLSPDKGWLEVGDIAIAERAYGAIRPLVRELLVAGDPDVAARLDASWVADEISDAGPLAGITGALSVVPAPLLLVAAWDMPFLSSALAAHMLKLAAHRDAVAPRTDRGPEPLFAVYRSTCLEPAREILAAGGRRPQKLLEAVSTRWVEGAELAVFGEPEVLFLSVNTPEDVERAASIARS